MNSSRILVGSTLLAAVVAVAGVAAGQRSGKYVPPRTPWGHPDLQGVWNNGNSTPLQRPDELAGREFLTDEELAARSEEVANRYAKRPANKEEDVRLAYNNEWYDLGKPLRRTSLIVDPPDGRLPPMTEEGKALVAARRAARASRGPADSYADRATQERCIMYHGVPPFPTQYNNNYQIAQNRDFVMIRYEMLSETRIIPLDGRPPLPSHVRQWIGSSRGRFEGDTLVVETSNFRPDATILQFPADNQSLRLIERFTRTAADTIDYRFTVHNPTVYTAPWTAVLPMFATTDLLYEYACHEGNYGMAGLLAGHRQAEREEAEREEAEK